MNKHQPIATGKIRGANGVTLPAPPWTREGRDALGNVYPLARPGLIRGVVDEGYSFDTPGGDVTTRRARVWKIDTHPSLRALSPDLRLAAMDYASAVEALGGSVGGQDFAAVGGGGKAGSRPPGEGALIAADLVRRCDAALDGEAVTIVLSATGWRNPLRTYRLPLVDLLRWVAVDGLSRGGVLQRMGLDCGDGSERLVGLVAIGLTEAARRVAVVQGLIADRPPVH